VSLVAEVCLRGRYEVPRYVDSHLSMSEVAKVSLTKHDHFQEVGNLGKSRSRKIVIRRRSQPIQKSSVTLNRAVDVLYGILNAVV
jgi:hypothetical protein